MLALCESNCRPDETWRWRPNKRILASTDKSFRCLSPFLLHLPHSSLAPSLAGEVGGNLSDGNRCWNEEATACSCLSVAPALKSWRRDHWRTCVRVMSWTVVNHVHVTTLICVVRVWRMMQAVSFVTNVTFSLIKTGQYNDTSIMMVGSIRNNNKLLQQTIYCYYCYYWRRLG